MPLNNMTFKTVPAAENLARELAFAVTPLKAYKNITNWVKHNIVYDHVKAAKIPKIEVSSPDPQRCWDTHLGICTDIAALTVIMLKAAKIKTQFVVGWANTSFHAWVESEIGGKKYRFDHSAGLIKPKYIPTRKF